MMGTSWVTLLNECYYSDETKEDEDRTEHKCNRKDRISLKILIRKPEVVNKRLKRRNVRHIKLDIRYVTHGRAVSLYSLETEFSCLLLCELY
jgi:hypothetical protein